MENQVIDYYNNYPYGINIIDKLNEEYNQLQEEKNKIEIQIHGY